MKKLDSLKNCFGGCYAIPATVGLYFSSVDVKCLIEGAEGEEPIHNKVGQGVGGGGAGGW